MDKQIRLDKYISESTGDSRSKSRQWIKKKRVEVNGLPVTDSGYKITPRKDEVCLDGILLAYNRHHYLMLHKPAGVISARSSDQEETVLDLVLGQDYPADVFSPAVYHDVFPVGRLDKDTEGLLLMTDDGELAHELLSPRKHVEKCYFALLDGPVGEKEAGMFREGLDIGDEKKTMPAGIRPATEEEMSRHLPDNLSGYGVYVTLKEGRYHQVKRMAKAVGREVVYLKRISMGSLVLDPCLKPGQCRPLTREEVDRLKENNS